MPPWSTCDKIMISLKAASNAGTTGKVTIPVHGSAGVNLSAIGWVLGLEPSTVMLNGYFVSRGPDFVSSLPWDSLVSFFSARGLPAGASLLDAILVQGKPTKAGFKRKVTLDNGSFHKKNRFFEGCSKYQNVGTQQVTDEDILSIKGQLNLADDRPSKKGKIGECNSDQHSFSSVKNLSHLCLKGEGTAEDEKNKKNDILLKYCSLEQNFVAEHENNDELFCMKKWLKIEDEHPFKKLKIDEQSSDQHSSFSVKNLGHLCFIREGATEDEKIQKNNILFEYSSVEQNFIAEEEHNDFFCMKKRLKLEDDRPFKRRKITELNFENQTD